MQGTSTASYIRALPTAGNLYLGYGSTNNVLINSSGLDVYGQSANSGNVLTLYNSSLSSGYGGTVNNNTGIVLGNASYTLGTIVATDTTASQGAYLSNMSFNVQGGNGTSNSTGITIRGVGGQAYVGINGKPTPAYALDVNGPINSNSSGSNSFMAYTNGSIFYGMGTIPSALCFSANLALGTTTPQMVLTSSGYVGIGKTNPAYALDVAGTVNATSFNSGSDYRIKEDVVTLDDSFTVDKLRPVTYNNTKLKKQDIGLIAHELQEVYPFLVNGEKDGENLQSVNYSGLIGILIKEIQELKKEVKMLKENFTPLKI